MWLLSTDRAELQFFHHPESVPGGYAILSHVWEAKEQTFEETQELRTVCATTGHNPRDRASPKVRVSCTIAERLGFRWIWNDTCCINKQSSSELSEAINAMFSYYSLAKVCCAYLCDVSSASREAVNAEDSEFRRSKWHKRGWTLQELIAPPFLVFLSKDWTALGTKMDLAELLEEITRVPVAVLQMTQAVSEVSIARRMSWACDRETTRVEDMAYCLMGIFSINMPPLYGEGSRAFLRLQEEIMRRSFDPSLFVWEDPDMFDGFERNWARFTKAFPESRRTEQSPSCYHTSSRYFLLASSPQAFVLSSSVYFRPPAEAVKMVRPIDPFLRQISTNGSM